MKIWPFNIFTKKEKVLKETNNALNSLLYIACNEDKYRKEVRRLQVLEKDMKVVVYSPNTPEGPHMCIIEYVDTHTKEKIIKYNCTNNYAIFVLACMLDSPVAEPRIIDLFDLSN